MLVAALGMVIGIAVGVGTVVVVVAAAAAVVGVVRAADVQGESFCPWATYAWRWSHLGGSFSPR